MKAKSNISRRQFLAKATLASGSIFILPGLLKADATPIPLAGGLVTLGNTGLKLSKLGMGTGTFSGNVQRGLGFDGFNKLIRFGYDCGLTYIDTADSYKTHEYVSRAIKGLPREKLFILTKMSGGTKNPKETLERFLKELDTDYIDCVLVHCATSPTWDQEAKPVMDYLSEAKEKKLIKTKGVSCHGLPALRRTVDVDWVEVQLVRINPQGKNIDGPDAHWNKPGNETNVSEVVSLIRKLREKGRGILGMKLMGEGAFKDPEDREKSIKFAYQRNLIHSATIGFASTAELAEAVERVNRNSQST